MKYRRYLVALITLAFLSFTVFQVRSQQAPIDYESCYGERLDILGVVHRSDGRETQVPMSLPDPKNWLVELAEKPSNRYLRYQPCQPEPILARNVFYGRFESEMKNSLGIPGNMWNITLRFFETGGPIWTGLGRLQDVKESGIPLEGGLTWLNTHGDKASHPSDQQAAQGKYLYPPEHRSPVGEPVIRSCGQHICSVRYGLNAHTYVTLEYWNNVPFEKWLEIDKRTQATIMALFLNEDN